MRLLSEIRNYMGNYHVKSGVYHYYRKEFSQALGFLRKALADDETLSGGERRTANCYLTLSLKGLAEKLATEGNLEAGLAELAQAAEVDPTYPDLYFERARLLERLGRQDEAVRAYRDAIARHPGYLEANIALGNCLLSANRVEEAVTVFRRALDLHLERVRRPFDQGIALLREGAIDAARQYLHEAFLSAPQLSREYLGKAQELMRAGQPERALAELDRALVLNPKYPDLHNLRGIALCELERFDEALLAFRRSTELGRGQLLPRLNYAFACLRAQRPEAAEAELEAILELDREEPVARAKLDELRQSRIPERERRGVGERP